MADQDKDLEKKENEITENDLEQVSGGLNPQPLPPLQDGFGQTTETILPKKIF